METVIILKSAGSHGKTQTLKILINNLIANGATIVYEQGYVQDETTDCFIILDLPDYGKLGIITNGDPGCEDAVNDALVKCKDNECKAVIGASRTKESSTHDTVYTILWNFGDTNKAKIMETSTIFTFPNWGQPIAVRDLNAICADNLETLLRRI